MPRTKWIHRALMGGVLLTLVGTHAFAEREEDDRHEKRHGPSKYKEIPPAVQREVSYTKDVEPILDENCSKCHSGRKHKGDFKIDTREQFLKRGEEGPAVVVGNSAKSHLIKMLAGVGVEGDEIMPPKDQLSADEIGIIRAWIDQGLKWDAPANPAPAAKGK